jgi:hypothetical protein
METHPQKSRANEPFLALLKAYESHQEFPTIRPFLNAVLSDDERISKDFSIYDKGEIKEAAIVICMLPDPLTEGILCKRAYN